MLLTQIFFFDDRRPGLMSSKAQRSRAVESIFGVILLLSSFWVVWGWPCSINSLPADWTIQDEHGFKLWMISQLPGHVHTHFVPPRTKKDGKEEDLVALKGFTPCWSYRANRPTDCCTLGTARDRADATDLQVTKPTTRLAIPLTRPRSGGN